MSTQLNNKITYFPHHPAYVPIFLFSPSSLLNLDGIQGITASQLTSNERQLFRAFAVASAFSMHFGYATLECMAESRSK